MTDSFGLGWRHELATDILMHLDAIDVVEVMIDDFIDRRGSGARAIRTLSSNVPVVLHGLSLGLASTVPVQASRLQTFATFIRTVQPRFWSEHLAFVRAGDVEVGHLLAPARTIATAQAAIGNIRAAADAVGSAPLLENIATFMTPPGSDMDEASWITEVISGSGCDLLLDLHNVHTNTVNCGGDPFAFLAALPAQSIRAVHLAGGQLIDEPHDAATWRRQDAAMSRGDDVAPRRRRVLDDHKHPVPDVVYDLLTEVGRRVDHPLTVLLEYDGAYPPFEELLAQLTRARVALAQGRAHRSRHELASV